MRLRKGAIGLLTLVSLYKPLVAGDRSLAPDDGGGKLRAGAIETVAPDAEACGLCCAALGGQNQ